MKPAHHQRGLAFHDLQPLAQNAEMSTASDYNSSFSGLHRRRLLDDKPAQPAGGVYAGQALQRLCHLDQVREGPHTVH
jgi:hypothetical protein